MIVAHFQAFKTLIDTAGVPVYDAESPDGVTGGFVTLYSDDGAREQVDLADANPLRVWTIQTTCNGDTAEQARLIAQKVEGVLEGVRPVVTGRKCERIKRHIVRPVERDDDVPEPRFYAVSQWRWRSTPA